MNQEISELWNRLNSFQYPEVTTTIDRVFESFQEGDFEYEDTDPGDAYIYSCGESECPVGWHRSYRNWKFTRKDGKRSIELHTRDEDGNWDFDSGWDEGEDPTEILRIIEHEMTEYFMGWAKYDLECAAQGKDILSDEDRTEEQALKSARENINYLYVVKHG